MGSSTSCILPSWYDIWYYQDSFDRRSAFPNSQHHTSISFFVKKNRHRSCTLAKSICSLPVLLLLQSYTQHTAKGILRDKHMSSPWMTELVHDNGGSAYGAPCESDPHRQLYLSQMQAQGNLQDQQVLQRQQLQEEDKAQWSGQGQGPWDDGIGAGERRISGSRADAPQMDPALLACLHWLCTRVTVHWVPR